MVQNQKKPGDKWLEAIVAWQDRLTLVLLQALREFEEKELAKKK